MGWKVAGYLLHPGAGGGPPPHSHSREDETFTVLEGDFEILAHGHWQKLPVGEICFAPRGSIHTFRNVGSTTGKIAVFMSRSRDPGMQSWFIVGHRFCFDRGQRLGGPIQLPFEETVIRLSIARNYSMPNSGVA